MGGWGRKKREQPQAGSWRSLVGVGSGGRSIPQSSPDLKLHVSAFSDAWVYQVLRLSRDISQMVLGGT